MLPQLATSETRLSQAGRAFMLVISRWFNVVACDRARLGDDECPAGELEPTELGLPLPEFLLLRAKVTATAAPATATTATTTPTSRPRDRLGGCGGIGQPAPGAVGPGG